MQQYLELLRAIKEKGTYKPAARENMPGTQSLFGYQFRHDLSTSFPLLTTKKMFWKGVVIELLWFLRGDTNIKYLIDNGVNIWNEDAYQYYRKIWAKHRPGQSSYPTLETFISMIKGAKSVEDLSYKDDPEIPNNYKLGDCGFQYGRVWRNWSAYQADTDEDHNDGIEIYQEYGIDQIKNLIEGLKKNPESRRHIVTAIDPAHDTDLALYWCHCLMQFNCRPIDNVKRAHLAVAMCKLHRNEIMFDEIENPGRTLKEQLDEADVPKYYLDCQLYQRSADVFLGVPFNIASYALLTEIVARICNMIPGEFVHTFGDVHIYDNHRDAVEEQLKRTPMALPQLIINTEFWNPEKVMGETDVNVIPIMTLDDFHLAGYDSYPPISAELSTGLKK